MLESKSFAEEEDLEASGTHSGPVGLWHINILMRVIAYGLNRAISVDPVKLCHLVRGGCRIVLT